MTDEIAFLLVVAIILKYAQPKATVTGCVGPPGTREAALRSCGCHNDGENWKIGKCNCAGGLTNPNASAIVQCNTINPSVCDLKCRPNNGCIVRLHLVNAANVKHVLAAVPIKAPNTKPEVYECCEDNVCDSSVCSSPARKKRKTKTGAANNDYTCCPVYTNQNASQCKTKPNRKRS